MSPLALSKKVAPNIQDLKKMIPKVKKFWVLKQIVILLDRQSMSYQGTSFFKSLYEYKVKKNDNEHIFQFLTCMQSFNLDVQLYGQQ